MLDISDAKTQVMAFAVIGPNGIGSRLTEEKFAAIKAKLSDKDVQQQMMDGWDTIVAQTANNDWGFADGDRDGFFDAVIAGLRALMEIAKNGVPLAGLAPILNLTNSIDGYGDYTYGGYEALLPILEGVGLKNLPNSVDYTAAYAPKDNKDFAAYDSLLRPVFDSHGDFLDELTADPFNTLIDVLGRLAYMVSSGQLNTDVAALLGQLNGFAIPAIDLSADALNTMLSSLVAGIQIEGKALNFLPIDWNTLGSLGTLKVVDSAVATNQYRADFVADRPAAFAMVVDYLVEMIAANSDAILGIASSIEGVEDFLPIVEPLLSNPGDLRTMLYDLLAPARALTFTDEKTGITLTADTSLLPEDGVLTVEKLAADDSAVSGAMKDIANRFSAYSITVMRNGKAVSPDGKVTITMPMDTSLNAERFAVYLLGEDAAATAATFTVADGVVTVKTDKLGSFVMAQVKENVELPTEEGTTGTTGDPSEETPGTNNPGTGDIVIASVAAAALVAGASLLVMKKKNQE